jgi:hypothetical protein
MFLERVRDIFSFACVREIEAHDKPQDLTNGSVLKFRAGG